MARFKRINVDDIIVYERHRKDLGDIEGLAADIEANGLYHPVVVNHDNELLIGERRLAAVVQLGWDKIDCTIGDAARIRAYVHDGKVFRINIHYIRCGTGECDPAPRDFDQLGPIDIVRGKIVSGRAGSFQNTQRGGGASDAAFGGLYLYQ